MRIFAIGNALVDQEFRVSDTDYGIREDRVSALPLSVQRIEELPVSCPINKCGFSAQGKGCGKARSAGNTLPYCQGTQRGHCPSPARPSGVGTIADGCVAALGNMPDIPCGLRLALGDCSHSESHLFMGQDTRACSHYARRCCCPLSKSRKR